MPILIDQEQFKRTLSDGASGASVTFVYRRPTNAEQLAYDRAISKGKTKNTGQRVRTQAQKMVKPLISGIQFEDPENALAWKKGDQVLVLSSTPGDPGYREDWLEAVEAFSPGLLRLLGVKLFAGETDEDLAEDEEGPNS